MKRKIMITRNGKTHEQTVVIKYGRFQKQITDDMWKSFWVGFTALYVTFWLGVLVGVIWF